MMNEAEIEYLRAQVAQDQREAWHRDAPRREKEISALMWKGFGALALGVFSLCAALACLILWPLLVLTQQQTWGQGPFVWLIAPFFFGFYYGGFRSDRLLKQASALREQEAP